MDNNTCNTLLAEDVATFLSEDIVESRMEAFRSKVEEQGGTIEIRPRNPVMKDTIETSQELARRLDTDRTE